MKNFKKTKVAIGASIGGIITLILIVYSLSWFWMEGQIKEEINSFLTRAKQNNVHVLTRSLGITGFPRSYEIHFSGRVTIDGTVLEIPDLQIHSNFLLGTPLILEAPQGVSILDPALTDIGSLDFLHIETEIPDSLPADLTREDLTLWKQANNKIVLKNMEIRKNTLTLKANGNFELDHMLQPIGEFNARITGHMDFLYWLQERKHIQTREALLATAVLSGLSKKDSEGPYINIILTLQNQTLFMGPLRLIKLPSIHWRWRPQLQK